MNTAKGMGKHKIYVEQEFLYFLCLIIILSYNYGST